MTREQFMQSLEKLLAVLPAEERRDALDYYDEYFDAAGPDREAETIAELGSPEEVAQKILEDQPQPSVPADAEPSLPPHPETSSARKALCWAGLAVAAVILCMYLFQHSSARRAVQTAENQYIHTSSSTSEHSAQTDSVTAVPLESIKHLTLDLDIGSVIFEEQADLTEASVTFKNPDPHATLHTDFKASGSTISYQFPHNDPGSENDTFSVTITLPVGFEMDFLDAELDMGSLTLGNLHVNNLNADLDMGSATADSLTCKTADIELDMGSFTARQVEAKTITAESAMGSVSIGLLRTEKADLSTDMGSVTVSLPAPAQDYAIYASSDLGKLTIDGQKYSESYHSSGRYPVTLSTSMGTITVNYK